MTIMIGDFHLALDTMVSDGITFWFACNSLRLPFHEAYVLAISPEYLPRYRSAVQACRDKIHQQLLDHCQSAHNAVTRDPKNPEQRWDSFAAAAEFQALKEAHKIWTAELRALPTVAISDAVDAHDKLRTELARFAPQSDARH